MITEVSRVGKRGTVVIPAGLRRRFNVTEGSYMMTEERPEGILLRPAAVIPMESYSPERKAEFLLSTAINAADYADAIKEVKSLGLDPAKIKHHKPAGA
jgi:AbrB family looped-hinge helix DNA binding protein